MTYWNRWPREKHEQIKQLLAYAQMCGLTGKDLVSLGSHLDRQQIMNNTQSLMSVVHAMPIALVDGDSSRLWHEQKWWSKAWIITAKNGLTYQISHGDFMRFNCRSQTGETRKVQTYNYHSWPRHWGWAKRQSYSFLLDVDGGFIRLDW